MNKALNRKRNIILLGNLALMLFCGLIYAWSIFVIPLEQEFGWTRSQTSLTFTFSLTFSTLAASVASFIIKKVKPQRLIFACALLLAVGFLLVSRVQELWQLYFFYSLVCGVPIGFVYNICPTNIVVWFKDKPNAITGILLMAFGISGMVFGQIASVAIYAYGWRTAFVLFGAIGLVVVALCSFSVIQPTAAEQAVLDSIALQRVNAGSQLQMTPKQMVRDRRFIFYSIFFISFYSVSLGVSSQGSPMAQFIGLTPIIATTFAGIISVCNGIGRVVWGRCLDTRGREFVVHTASAINLGMVFLLLAAIWLRQGWLLLIAFVLSGLAGGSTPVLAMNIVKSRYGDRNYGINVGIANLNIIVGSFTGPYLAGVLFQKSNEYLPVVFMVIIFAAIMVFYHKHVLNDTAVS